MLFENVLQVASVHAEASTLVPFTWRGKDALKGLCPPVTRPLPLTTPLPTVPPTPIVQRLLRLSVLYSLNRIQNSESPGKSTGLPQPERCGQGFGFGIGSGSGSGFLWLRNSFVYIFLINFNTEIVDVTHTPIPVPSPFHPIHCSCLSQLYGVS